jgi:hypothetical protein
MNRKLAIAASALVLAAPLGACTSHKNGAASNARKQEATQQAQDTLTLIQAQPVPHFDWSQIRQTLIDIEGAQAHAIQTTSFFFQQGMNHPYLVCNSIGFPVPASDELTNPQQIVTQGSLRSGGGNVTIDQQDPTGIYTADTAGTFVLCVNRNGQAEAQYAEPFVHTVAGPAAWNTATQMIEFTGNPTAAFNVGK